MLNRRCRTKPSGGWQMYKLPKSLGRRCREAARVTAAEKVEAQALQQPRLDGADC